MLSTTTSQQVLLPMSIEWDVPHVLAGQVRRGLWLLIAKVAGLPTKLRLVWMAGLHVPQTSTVSRSSRTHSARSSPSTLRPWTSSRRRLSAASQMQRNTFEIWIVFYDLLVICISSGLSLYHNIE